MSQHNDYKWFLEHYQKLFAQYGTSYLAIKDKKVLGIYDSYKNAIEQTQFTEPLGTFIVQYCNGLESGYTTYVYSDYF